MAEYEEELGTQFLAVTSAHVLVPDRDAFDALLHEPDVFAIDPSIEQVRRSIGVQDVVVNDLYWDLAGSTDD